MKNLYHRLLLLIAGATRKELASQVGYLPVDKPKKGTLPPGLLPISQIECRERLGGLLKHYYRKAA